MITITEPERQIPVLRETDVIVVGGGPAGLAAAVASARMGAHTILIEQFGYLGGTATASLMACINGFRNQVDPEHTQVVRGIAEEIVLELKELNGLGTSPYPQKSYPTTPGQLEYSYAIDTEKFKYVVLRMCVASGVDLLLHTTFARPYMVGDEIHGVFVENKSGRLAILGKTVVDASGDADVAARAGASFWQVKHAEAPRLNDALMYRVQFGAQRPTKPYACDFGAHAVVWGPAPGPIDGTNGDELSRAEVRARLAVYEDLAEKQRNTPELSDAQVLETPPLLGIRQTRFVKGEYTLTAQDALDGCRFDDVVAISPCPIIHYYGYRRYLPHEGYDIPYRCLIPLHVESLLVAGRCISSEQQPYESHRAMVPIMAIGQAAGVAAALAADSGIQPRHLSSRTIQEHLIAQGAQLRIEYPNGQE